MSTEQNDKTQVDPVTTPVVVPVSVTPPQKSEVGVGLVDPVTPPPSPAPVPVPPPTPETSENTGLLGKVKNTLNQATPLDSKGFQTNLFGCFDSGIKNLCYSFLCPCCVSANTHTILENRECTIFDCMCFPNAYQTRQSIRQRYNLPTDTGLDCIGVALCYSCSVNQNVRELERLARGAMWVNNDESRRLANAPSQQNMD
jgi:Cys-rich protein (TIGR01571 family)